MQNSIRIGRIAGIDIGVHWSWFFIFFLLTWSLSTGLFDEDALTDGERWTAGTATSVIFFGSVLLHELSHSVVARRLGLPVRSITLFVFGGVSNLERDSDTAKSEFLIAIVGPATSFALALIFLAVWATLGQTSNVIEEPALWLAIINFSLFVFNMLPGFPLDGGRILRSIVWWKNRNHLRATEISSRVGVWLAWLLIAGGVAMVFFGGLLPGLWIIMIAWFMRNAAETSYAQTLMEDVLSGLKASDVATTDYETVPPDMDLQTLVTDYVLRRHQRTFPVVVAGHLQGLVTLSDIKGVPQERWPETSVYRAMRPADQLHTVGPDTPLQEVVATMGQHDVNQLPVVDHYGELLGMVTRADVLRLIQVRSEVASPRR